VAAIIHSMMEASDEMEEDDELVTEEFVTPHHFGKVQFGAPQKPCTFESLE
jgi:hypothetical protein